MIRNFPELLEMREKNFPVLFGTACWGKISCTVHDCLGKDFLYCPWLLGKDFLYCPRLLGKDFLYCPWLLRKKFPALSMTAGGILPVLSNTNDCWEKFSCPWQLGKISLRFVGDFFPKLEKNSLGQARPILATHTIYSKFC